MRKTCAACGQAFEAKRAATKFCGDRCRQRAHRNPSNVSSLPVAEPEQGQLEVVTLSELDEAERSNSSAGQAALALARRIDGARSETGSSLAALVREYRATLADALQDVQKAADPLDELRLRRDRKLG